MALQISLTVLLYLLLALIPLMLTLIWRENIANNRRQREDQAKLVESIMQSVTVSSRSVTLAEELAASIKQAVAAMQNRKEHP